MKQTALGAAVFLTAGAVHISTGNPSYTFVVAFVSIFVFAYYAVVYPDPPTEYEE